MKKFYVLTFMLLFAYAAFASGPYFFTGYVLVNGSLADNGTIVEAYINGASLPVNSVVLGQGQLGGTPQGWYSMAAVGNPGDTVAFRVNNLTLNSANGTNTSAQTLTGTLDQANGVFNLSVNKSSNGASCLYAGGCSSSFCANSYCCDTACTTSGYSCAVSGSLGTCTSTGSSSSSSSSSGGGSSSSSSSSGGGTALPSSTSPAVSVSEGSSSSFTFDQTLVDSIDIHASNIITSASITVKEIGTPASASVAVSSDGAVYKYLEITPTFTNDKISSAKVKFKVPQSWFATNSINPATTALKKLVNGVWTTLPTTQTSFDGTTYFFEATTTSFSTYAVTGLKSASFFDVISKIDAYYKGTVSFFDVITIIDLYYKSQ